MKFINLLNESLSLDVYAKEITSSLNMRGNMVLPWLKKFYSGSNEWDMFNVLMVGLSHDKANVIRAIHNNERYMSVYAEYALDLIKDKVPLDDAIDKTIKKYPKARESTLEKELKHYI
jgi:hypothetical protein